MRKDLKEYQDAMIEMVIEAKKLQDESGWKVGLAMDGVNDSLVPVENIITCLLNMTTREAVKNKLRGI